MVNNSEGTSNKVKFWTVVVELFRQSGLSCTKFCMSGGD